MPKVGVELAVEDANEVGDGPVEIERQLIQHCIDKVFSKPIFPKKFRQPQYGRRLQASAKTDQGGIEIAQEKLLVFHIGQQFTTTDSLKDKLRTRNPLSEQYEVRPPTDITEVSMVNRAYIPG